jgi:hypothetical protein
MIFISIIIIIIIFIITEFISYKVWDIPQINIGLKHRFVKNQNFPANQIWRTALKGKRPN